MLPERVLAVGYGKPFDACEGGVSREAVVEERFDSCFFRRAIASFGNEADESTWEKYRSGDMYR